jgi:hypothetical protein
LIPELRINQLTKREWVEAVGEVASHQTVATFPVEVEPRTSGDHNADIVRMTIKETLQEAAPTPVLVQLIEDENHWRFLQFCQPEPLNNRRDPARNHCTIVIVIPV